MSDHINQIKNRILTSALVGRYITLKTKPNGEFAGLCPFHAENTPSFTVNDNKGFFHCFGCQEHGDIFTFVMKMENCDYKTALTQLANDAGVSLPVYNQQTKEKADAHAALYKINEITTTYYQQCLFSPAGKHALVYFEQRGLTREIIAQYRLGYAPASWHELYQLLHHTHKFSDGQIAEAQALRRGENGWYNMFRNRVIFPIQDRQARIIAFGGRILGQGEPKYLNSPESPIFIKGEHLYGLNHAYKTAAKQRNILLVEGYMDVLSLAAKGIANVVAPLGTSLKVSQVQALWHIVPEPTICLDADASGKRATNKVALEIIPFLQPKHSLKICQLSGGKDPDEVINQKGVAFFQQLLEKSVPLAQFLFNQIITEFDLNTPEGQAGCEQHLQNLSRQIADAALQKNYYFFWRDALRNYLWQRKLEKRNYPRNNEKNINNINEIKQHLLPGSVINSSIVTVLLVLHCNPEMLNDAGTTEQLADLEIDCKVLDNIRNNLLSMEGYELAELGALDKDKLRVAFYEQLKPDAGLLRAAMCIFLEVQHISALEMKQYLKHAFNVASLGVLAKQITLASQLLSANPEDEACFTRMIELKKHQERLKTELGII